LPVLDIKSLSKRFGGLSAIKDVSFEVASGTVSALIGPNGAGKTTVFNLITNVFSSDRGEVLFLGKSLLGLSPV
jgi:branched-chain amino acid transport system ATP-binding protein